MNYKILTVAFAALSLFALNPTHAAEGKVPAPLQKALNEYSIIQVALAADSLKGVAKASTALAKTVQEDKTNLLPKDLEAQALALSKATDLKAARDTFKPLSATLISVLSAQSTKTGRYFKASCPMAGASWIQTEKPIKNPYYGSSMLTCGTIDQEL